MSNAPSLLSVSDACRNLCISSSYFYLLVKRGEITPVKLGRRTLVPRTEVERVVGFPSETAEGLISKDQGSAEPAKQFQIDK